jgi:tryptophan-rich hypothetical protein
MARPPANALRPGAKWTATAPEDRAKHFEVVVRRDDRAELRCIVTGAHHLVALEALADGERWLPGWR